MGDIVCTWCHAAATADNICQRKAGWGGGRGVVGGSVDRDNPNNVF